MVQAFLTTLLATVFLAGWLMVASIFGWLTGGVSLTLSAWVGQFTPAIATLLIRWFRREKWTDAGFRFSSFYWYFKAWVTAIALFISAFAISALLGWGTVARSWSDIAVRAKSLGFVSLSPEPVGIIGFMLFSLFVLPLLLSFFALGEEIGWRGYVLPNLLPLGRRHALIISGLLGSVWHIPLVLVGQAYPGHRVTGLLLIFPFITGVWIILGYFRLGSGSVFVSTLLHGTLNAQMIGPAVLIVAISSPIYGGFMGIAGIVIVWIAALWCLRFNREIVW
ncbi:CPBP family glutamic-type intramembrane protease [Fischerella sp. PCC 9605]|uniref:CPBP family glutamic-type intramembrane protease n=1 Tax=Fischerella sp. PCC 9605 TaxID=1173024 RepID=UPI000479BE1F|nr:CPBP family glutamic-type intramembrane protease [Fischerella sp. PCC 9605]